jgi:hypothetical protein
MLYALLIDGVVEGGSGVIVWNTTTSQGSEVVLLDCWWELIVQQRTRSGVQLSYWCLHQRMEVAC